MRRILATSTDWMDDAECTNHPSEWWTDTATIRGPRAWRSDVNKQAQAICRTCPVLAECAIYIRHIETPAMYSWGIYAGLRPDQRNRRISVA